MEEAINPNLSEKAMYDYKLVRKALKDSDQQAYAELMHRYHDSVYFMLLKMVNNKDDADDLTIEAFGKAFKRLELYTPTYAFSTWLFKIATNNCIDFIRTKKKATLFSIDKPAQDDEGAEMSIELRSDFLDPEEKAIKKQKIKIMHLIVDKLKPRYRRLIEMRYFREMSYEEIAQELKQPLGTVKAQLFRARELLFQIMKNKEGKI